VRVTSATRGSRVAHRCGSSPAPARGRPARVQARAVLGRGRPMTAAVSLEACQEAMGPSVTLVTSQDSITKWFPVGGSSTTGSSKPATPTRPWPGTRGLCRSAPQGRR
jgi:hypothetical protein